MKPPPAPPLVVGWCEWVALPGLGLPAVRAKVDTGAATSAIHAYSIERFARDGAPWARFEVHPFFRRRRQVTVACEAPVVDISRLVRSSSGHIEERLVVRVVLRLGVRVGAPEFEADLTLADRWKMQFPMLVGREALAGRALVDAGATFRLGRLARPGDYYALSRA